MKFLVLGAGRMGYAVAYDLIRSPRVEQVVLSDKNPEQVQKACKRLSDPKIIPVELDVTQLDEVATLMANCDMTISCVAPEYSYELAKIALQARVHFCASEWQCHDC